MSELTEYFSDRAGDYARFRPSYPEAAVTWILSQVATAPASVADVGCGTGIFSRLLAAQGARVTGVEPSVAMREAAEAAGGRVCYRDGSGEATGLDAGSVDLVTVAQAFHWFDAEAALREFERITRPGGRLALLWNVRDDTTPFGSVYAETVRRAKANAATRGRVVRNARTGDPEVGGHFRVLERRSFPNPHALTWEALIGRAQSASYYPPAGEPLREELTACLREAFDAHQVEGRVRLDQETQVTLAERRA